MRFLSIILTYLKNRIPRKFSRTIILNDVVLEVTLYYNGSFNDDWIEYNIKEYMDHYLIRQFLNRNYTKTISPNSQKVNFISNDKNLLRVWLQIYSKSNINIFSIEKLKLQHYSEYKKNERNKKIEKLLN